MTELPQLHFGVAAVFCTDNSPSFYYHFISSLLIPPIARELGMFTRQLRDTAAWRACINKSGRFQSTLAVFLILCLCITSAKALRQCVDGKPEEGLNACPCQSGFPSRRDLSARNYLSWEYDAAIIRLPLPTQLIYPVGWEKLTWSDQCAVERQCTSSPQCCIELCGSNPGMECDNENDCRTINEGNVFWGCVARRSCLQYNDSRCTAENTGTVTFTHCFCQKYDRRCSDLVTVS